jgi:hypothetical protein
LLAYSLPNRKAPLGTGSAPIMLPIGSIHPGHPPEDAI